MIRCLSIVYPDLRTANNKPCVKFPRISSIKSRWHAECIIEISHTCNGDWPVLRNSLGLCRARNLKPCRSRHRWLETALPTHECRTILRTENYRCNPRGNMEAGPRNRDVQWLDCRESRDKTFTHRALAIVFDRSDSIAHCRTTETLNDLSDSAFQYQAGFDTHLHNNASPRRPMWRNCWAWQRPTMNCWVARIKIRSF